MSEELTIEERKKAINLQDLVYVKKYIDGRHYSKAETEAKIDEKLDDAKDEIGTQIDAAIEASSKSYTKEESDDLFLKKADTSTLSVRAQSLLDTKNNEYKKIAIVTAEEYNRGPANSSTIYFVKE